MDQQRVLVFTMAMNGYQYVYRNLISTHKAYAARYGFEYAVVNKPAFTGLLMECCWLKLVLLLSALETGYDWVFYIDADAEIKGSCPDFRTLEKEGKSLYMAEGFSGRINSGVIIVKNTPEIRAFVRRVLREYAKTLPIEDDVGWGENGHIIHFSKGQDFLQIISPVWNNNHTPELDDYVRHYSAGPMRPYFDRDVISRLASFKCVAVQRFLKKTGLFEYDSQRFPDRLLKLFAEARKGHGEVFRALKDPLYS